LCHEAVRVAAKWEFLDDQVNALWADSSHL
jgi:hypothetical protein